MPLLVLSDDVRSGRPRLVTACTGVSGLKQTRKTQTQKQQYKFLLKKIPQIPRIHQILKLFDYEQYIFIFLSHDLIALLNALFQKFNRC